uniref:Uncharacterized protein n=1 Tax=Rhizophora mucronata TaxID=61149 RepID=A0A2P2ISY4_RHIMU
MLRSRDKEEHLLI